MSEMVLFWAPAIIPKEMVTVQSPYSRTVKEWVLKAFASLSKAGTERANFLQRKGCIFFLQWCRCNHLISTKLYGWYGWVQGTVVWNQHCLVFDVTGGLLWLDLRNLEWRWVNAKTEIWSSFPLSCFCIGIGVFTWEIPVYVCLCMCSYWYTHFAEKGWLKLMRGISISWMVL